MAFYQRPHRVDESYQEDKSRHDRPRVVDRATRAKHDKSNCLDVGPVSTCADGRAGANCEPVTCEDDAACEVAKRLGDESDGHRRMERARRVFVFVGPIYTRL